MKKERKDGSVNRIELTSNDAEITLGQYTIEDADGIFALIDRNRTHLSQHHEDTAEKYPTLQALQESITNPSNPRRLRFAIRNRQNVIVGGINITPDENSNEQAEIGYWQGEEFTGKGYVGRAVEALTAFGFEELGFQVIYAKVFKTNTSSIRVLQRAGFEKSENQEGYIKFTKTNSSTV
jgi:RimJ/RimL family protein N-acetyltransferase